MKEISRRTLLRGVGHAAAFGTLAAALPRFAQAAEGGDSAICLSMNYANTPNAKFDAERFGEKHLPLLRGIYGDCVERIELRVPKVSAMPAATAPKAQREAPTPGSARAPMQMPAMPGPPPSLVLAAISLWIRDVKAFGEKTAAARSQIAEDLAQVVTGSQPMVQYDRVLALLGDSRESIAVDSDVTSYYFLNGEDAQFDAKNYNDHVIPTMVKIYGEKALHRIEFSTGLKAAEGGGQPALVAAAHYYVRDRAAWDQAGLAGAQQLAAAEARYAAGKRVKASMRVAAAD